ncbi:Rha family transcriptional regulator [Levilactobacillus fuyuanensis]|uniref:Rha family transcriptional regulator n=1 Tax=Levilactobacillus fuyuanensis TaxID=2486022 RepID=A0ABW4GZN4_9LACO|nr:Rha family transcriptional regulator [Levilactobacillus fuyuanensis]
MNDLVIMKNRQAVTTSLQVAEAFGKQHKDVMDTIRRKLQSAENSAHYQSMFAEGTYRDSRGRSQSMYYMNRNGWTFIAMGFTGDKADKFKLAYIDAFDAMQDELERQASLPMTPEEKLALVMETGNRANKRLTHVEGRLTDLEKNQKLDAGEYNWLGRRISKAVRDYMGLQRLKLSTKQRSELFRDINIGVCTVAHVKTRTQIREGYFDSVSDYISDWVPSTATLAIIKQLGTEMPVAQEA